MMNPIRLVALIRPIPAIRKAWDEIAKFLSQREQVQVLAEDPGPGIDFKKLAPDLAIVLGGDGAIIHFCRSMGKHQVPILSVNMGRLGFLADLDIHQFFARFPEIESREYDVVSHVLLECCLYRGEQLICSQLGVNEAAISSAGSLRMIDIGLSIDGEHVTTFSGDGVLISTPVGSTAHNLSAGGPILKQDIEALVVTPICPHTLSVRPMVDSADCEYVLTVPEIPAGVTLAVDGQLHWPLLSGDRVVVRRSPSTFQRVRLRGNSFYRTLHQKLGWTGQPKYGSDE